MAHRSSIQSVFVLGGSSAAASAICLELAQRGCRRFHLLSRQLQRQQPLVEQLHSFSGMVVSQEATDLVVDALRPLPVVEHYDLYLITAGSLEQLDQTWFDPSAVWQITAANYMGLIPWLLAIASPDRLQQTGRLWVFSSVAADRGRPSNAAYGAAKAALTSFCEGLHLRCQRLPFCVRVIKAGYMDTPMAKGASPVLTIRPQKVAQILLRDPDRRGVHYLPAWWALVMLLVRLLPDRIAARL